MPEIRQSTTGVIVPTTQLGTSLCATVAQGLKITINNGLAFIDGAYFFIYEPETITLQAGWVNDIVLRLDVTGSDIVFGIFNKQRSANTIEAGLTRQGGIYELGLHSVTIPANTDQVTAAMISDYRLNMGLGVDGKPCCGIVGSLLMLGANIIDYVTGLIAAEHRGSKVSSKRSIKGIGKKLCLWILVLVGWGIDCFINYLVGQMGYAIPLAGMICALIVIWLCINEIISILENLTDIGVPMPSFLLKLVKYIKKQVEDKTVIEDVIEEVKQHE
ncbi:MAG: phage holin family protein [Oscillospiraceae bacterium]